MLFKGVILSVNQDQEPEININHEKLDTTVAVVPVKPCVSLEIFVKLKIKKVQGKIT